MLRWPREMLIVLALAAMAGACDAPAQSDVVGAAIVDLPLVQEPLPEPVLATVRQLREIAATGGYRDMARLADAVPGFRSNNAGMSHRDYWYLKLRTGDWPMAMVGNLLDQPYAVAETTRGKVFVWPRLAALEREAITPADASAIDDLLGAGQAQAIREGAIWPGYVLGILEDGTWLYFVSGEG
jgi:hypothetical protein